MAYNFEVAGPEMITPGDGHRYVQWTVVETDVSPGDVWSIPSFPRLASLTLVACELTEPDAASTVQTEVSKEASLDPASIDYIDQAAEAGASVRLDTIKRCGPGNTLYGCSHVDAHANVVTTRVIAVIGHAP